MARPNYIGPTPVSGAMLAGIGQLGSDYREKNKKEVMDKEILEAAQSNNPEKMAEVSIKYPEMGKQIKEAFGILNPDTEKAATSAYQQAYVNPDNAEKYLEQGIAEVKGKGGTPTNMMRDLDLYRQNPEAAIEMFGMSLAALDGPGYKALASQRAAKLKAKEKANKVVEGTAGIKDFEYYQELKKTDPGSAEQFGRERGFISSEGEELSSHLQKRLSIASDDAIKSEGNVGQYSVLADQISEANVGGGLFGGSWAESMKDITGSQDAISQLRKQYNGIRASNVVKNLPPGSASDVDVKLAMGQFPTDNATGKEIASFLRGLSKLEQLNADFNNFKAEYISKNGTERGMLAAWKKQASKPTDMSDEELVTKYGE